MNFASDNTAPVTPAILDALAEASRGYGNDDWTQAAERRFCEIFERGVAAFLVPTGTVANALALAQVSPPWGAILCHGRIAHSQRRMRGARIFRKWPQACRLGGCGRQDHRRWPRRGAGPLWRSQSASGHSIGAVDHAGHRTRSPRSRKSRGSGRSRCTWTAPALPMRWSGLMRRPPR